LQAVRAFAQLPESESLAAANKRISNILRQASQKGEKFDVVGKAFGEKVDRDLHTALASASARAKPLFDQGDYTEYLKSFAVLKGPVDAFFDGAMVMAEDLELRRNRLGLLHTLQVEMNRVADIAKLAA
jgi:glycyl-tRNA synthetase beta chain